MLSIIAAISDNNVIGKDNKLLWNIPEDLKRFKNLTTGHVIIMGRKTFESLGKVLENRKHVVLTRDQEYRVKDKDVEIAHDIKDLDKYINDDQNNFVIGGAIVYRQLMEKAEKMYITRVHADFVGDAYFPKIDENEWKIVKTIPGEKDKDVPYDYEFVNYERVK